MQALSHNINQPVLGRGPALNSFPRHDLGHYLPLVLSNGISQCFSIALITIRVHFCYIAAVEYLQIRFRELLYFLVYAHLLGRYSLSKILLKASLELYVIRPRKSRELGITQNLIWESLGFLYLNAMPTVYYTFFYI